MKLIRNILVIFFWRTVTGYTSYGTSLCNDTRCECLQATFGNSMNVTCRCTPQDPEALLTLDIRSLPPTTGLLSIEGCRDVHVNAGALSDKPYLTDVLINDAGRIAFEPGSGNNIAATKTPGIHVRRCRELRIHTGAFANNARSPFSLEIAQCQSVHLHEAPFSGIRSITISNVARLHLSANTFRLHFGSNNNNIERHVGRTQGEKGDFKGDIRISHSKIVSGIPNSCFPSPLRRLELDNITTEEIGKDAFSSLNIEELLISNSIIGEIAEDAFQQPVLLTALEIRNCTIRVIQSRALSSAATNFVLSDCTVGTIEGLGVSMHAARNSIRHNRFSTVKSGALNMKSWNDLEIWNNTMETVEKNAFINIGLPDVEAFDDRKVPIRFAVKDNMIMNAQVGAFVFSAQAVMPSLDNNRFLRSCDCDLNKWAADLTQAVRSTDVAEITSLSSNKTETGALWIGSALFNNSFCKITQVESQCFMLGEPFLSMLNYTETYCPKTRAAVDCISRAKSKSETTEPPIGEFDTHIAVNNQPEVKKLDNDILLVIIFTVGLTVIILIAVISILLVKRRHQGKRRQSGSREGEGLVTCAPLLSLQEEAGAMRSGSISKLSLADYKTSLLPPPQSQQHTMSLTSQMTDTTEVDDHTMERSQMEHDTKTIDRGIQTDTGMMQTITDDFAEAVLAAIRDKLEISTTYSEVRDKLFPKKEEGPSCTQSPTGTPVDIYTKPWLGEYDINKEPIYSSILPKLNPVAAEQPTLKKGDSLTKAGLPPVKLDLTKETADEILDSLRSKAPSSVSSQSSEEPKSLSYFTYIRDKKDDSSLSDNEKKGGPRKTWDLQQPQDKAKSSSRVTSPKWPPAGYDATLKPVDTSRPSPRKSSGALIPTRSLTSPSAVRTAAIPPPKKESRPAWRAAGAAMGGAPAVINKKASKEDTPIIDTSTFVRKSNLKESDSPAQIERRHSVRFSSDESNKLTPVVSDYQAPSDAVSSSGALNQSDNLTNIAPPAPTVVRTVPTTMGAVSNMGEYSLPRDQIPSKQSLTYSEVSREVPITQRPLPKRPDSDEQVPVPTVGSENFYEQLTR